MNIPGKFLLFILITSLGLGGGVRLVSAVPFISKESEVSIGKGADLDVIRQYGIYQDKDLQIYVNDVGQKLVSRLSDKVFSRYFFKVVDSSQVNAFALPGGYIYVTRGILAMLNSEAELAGVMGHEIGHVILHHGAKAIIRSVGATILSLGSAIASPKNAGKLLILSTQLANQINLGYGRQAELDSDAQGVMDAYESGYDPESMVKFLSTLRRQEVFTGQGYHAFAATHPETKERILKVQTLAHSLSGKGEPRVTNRKIYLSHLQGIPFGGKVDVRDRRYYEDQYIDIYEVQAGDTFVSIATRELEDEKKDMEIAVLNGMKIWDPLLPGQWLKLVKKGKYDKRKELKIQPATN